MDDLDLYIPEGIVDALPTDAEETKQDMGRAIEGWERELNAALADNAVGAVVDIIDHFESRWEAYDGYVVELRAWGQSPIYAMAWRDLHAAVIQQVYDHDDLAERIDRERNARIVDDGIRHGGGSS